MTVIDGYIIAQYPNQNKIVIVLPQTISTISNTLAPIAKRRRTITQDEEAALLVAVKGMFEAERKGEEGERSDWQTGGD